MFDADSPVAIPMQRKNRTKINRGDMEADPNSDGDDITQQESIKLHDDKADGDDEEQEAFDEADEANAKSSDKEMSGEQKSEKLSKMSNKNSADDDQDVKKDRNAKSANARKRSAGRRRKRSTGKNDKSSQLDDYSDFGDDDEAPEPSSTPAPPHAPPEPQQSDHPHPNKTVTPPELKQLSDDSTSDKKQNLDTPSPSNSSSGPPPPLFESLLRNVPNLMAIEPIIAPDIYSGIFFKISAAGSQYAHIGTLSVGGSKENSTMDNPYLCLSVSNDTVDDTDLSSQWLFEKSETEGYYVLRNKRLPQGFVSWDDDDVQLLVIEMRREFRSQYQPEGIRRKNVLFKLEKQFLQTGKGKKGKSFGIDVYELSILGLDDTNTHIVVDTTFKDNTGCYLLRRTDLERTVEGDEFTSQLKIERPPTAIKIVGYLDTLKYKETSSDLFKRAHTEGTVATLESKQVFNHRDSELQAKLVDVHERRDRFRVDLLNLDMGIFSELWVPPGLSIGTVDPVDDEHPPKKPPMVRVNLEEGKDTVEKFRYKIIGQLDVEPWTSVEYSVIFGWLEELEIGFESSLKILGRGDRMKSSTRPKVVPNQVIDFPYVHKVLKEINFKFKREQETGHQGLHKNTTELYCSVAVKGLLMGKSLGVKGEIELRTFQLKQDVNTTCH